MRCSQPATAVVAAFMALIAQVPCPTLASTLPPECSEADSAVTCTYTAGDSLFAVPADITTIHVVAIGGAGWGTLAGHGARVEGDLAVPSSSTLHVIVAGNGNHYLGGFNGGRDGNACGFGTIGNGSGGASDVRSDTTLGSRLIVAGGGGGAGCGNGVQFSAGGDAGADGQAGNVGYMYGVGGQAGCASATSTNCGAGGTAGTGGSPGLPGVEGLGGAGGASAAWGGPGGGGYYGGGGGGSGACITVNAPCDVRGAGAGGGGGSSLVPAGGTASVDAAGVPEIEISYTVDSGSGPTPFKVVSATSTGSNSVDVIFDAAPDATQATTLANYAILGLTLSGTPSLVGSAVTLTTSAQAAQAYGVTVSNVTRASDAATLDWATATFTGTAPAGASLDTSQVDFGSQLVGTTSSATTVTLTNSGGESLSVSTASLTGSVGEFATTSNACINATLAPGEQCQVQVVFKPTTAGSKAATLRFTDNAGDSPQDVALSGFGTMPGGDVAVRIGAAPGAPKVGRALRYTITVSNAGPSAASGIVVTDVLPSQTTLVTATPSVGACGDPLGGTIRCTIPSLDAGAKVTIQIVVTVGTNGSLINAVSVASTTTDPNPANNTASVTSRVK